MTDRLGAGRAYAAYECAIHRLPSDCCCREDYDMVDSRVSSPFRVTVLASLGQPAKKTSTARMCTAGDPPRPSAIPPAALVQPPLDLSVAYGEDHGEPSQRQESYASASASRVDHELGTTQKYLDNYDASTYTRGGFVSHDVIYVGP
ncbi:hypothetical protein BDZ89DRAFT_1167398 [Hymenopellis radicata]|nr:hypothetical protein BDZ89DRAFT_1167398 [Hymenopellis radicata]